MECDTNLFDGDESSSDVELVVKTKMEVVSAPRVLRSRPVREAKTAANAAISTMSTDDDGGVVADYENNPELLFDSRVLIWLPYPDTTKVKTQRENVDGEYHYGTVEKDLSKPKKFLVKYSQLDRKSDYYTLDAVLKGIKLATERTPLSTL